MINTETRLRNCIKQLVIEQGFIQTIDSSIGDQLELVIDDLLDYLEDIQIEDAA